jgi:iron complex outermembrane receptor protein
VGNFSAGPSSVTCRGSNDTVGDLCYDGAILVDLELSYTWQDRYTFVAGASNLFDEYPDKDPTGPGSGNEYPTSTPWGFDGGFWYGRVRVNLD